jgi:hypothetical protein
MEEAVPLIEAYFLEGLRFMGSRRFGAMDVGFRRRLAEMGEEPLRRYDVRSRAAERQHRLLLEAGEDDAEGAVSWSPCGELACIASLPKPPPDFAILAMGRLALP